MALITSVQAQRHCANYGPRLFLYAHFAFLSRADFLLCLLPGARRAWDPPRWGACPGVAGQGKQLTECRLGTGSYGGWIWDICCLHREWRECFLDGQTPVLTGSHYSQLCRRPGLWSTQELVINNSTTPCYLVWAWSWRS